jgi:hypothetical protein
MRSPGEPQAVKQQPGLFSFLDGSASPGFQTPGLYLCARHGAAETARRGFRAYRLIETRDLAEAHGAEALERGDPGSARACAAGARRAR